MPFVCLNPLPSRPHLQPLPALAAREALVNAARLCHAQVRPAPRPLLGLCPPPAPPSPSHHLVHSILSQASLARGGAKCPSPCPPEALCMAPLGPPFPASCIEPAWPQGWEASWLCCRSVPLLELSVWFCSQVRNQAVGERKASDLGSVHSDPTGPLSLPQVSAIRWFITPPSLGLLQD